MTREEKYRQAVVFLEEVLKESESYDSIYGKTQQALGVLTKS